MRRLLAVITLVLILGVPTSAQAAAIGIFSFDLFADGTNTFSVTNLSGAFALPDAFPSLTEALLQDVHVELQSNQGVFSFGLGDVGEGGFLDAAGALVFLDTVQFTSAILTATLAPLSLALADGSVFDASPFVTATLLPSSGGVLQAGVDFAVIEALAAGPAPIPEPGTLLLTASGLAALATSLRRKRRRAGDTLS